MEKAGISAYSAPSKCAVDRLFLDTSAPWQPGEPVQPRDSLVNPSSPVTAWWTRPARGQTGSSPHSTLRMSCTAGGMEGLKMHSDVEGRAETCLHCAEQLHYKGNADLWSLIGFL